MFGKINAAVLAFIGIIGAVFTILENGPKIITVATLSRALPAAWLRGEKASLDWITANTGIRIWDVNVNMLLCMAFMALLAFSARLGAVASKSNEVELRAIAWRRILSHEYTSDRWAETTKTRIATYPSHALLIVVGLSGLLVGSYPGVSEIQMLIRMLLMAVGHWVIASIPELFAAGAPNFDAKMIRKTVEAMHNNKLSYDMLTTDDAAFDKLPPSVRAYFMRHAMAEYALDTYATRIWTVIVTVLGLGLLAAAHGLGYLDFLGDR
jgi:hypothetical protein